jgi:phage shock protein C
MTLQDNNKTKIRRLYRSRQNRMLTGVCAGFAEYLNIDTVFIRLIWIALTFFGGFGIILYIISSIIIPECPKEIQEETFTTYKSDGRVFWGALFIVIGSALLLKKMGFFYYFNIWHLPWHLLWALLLIGVGVIILINYAPTRTRPEANADNGLASSRKQLHRSVSNKMLAGVCAGIAEYFDWDATLVRLIYIFLAFASFGIALLVYFILMLVLPPAHEQNPSAVKEN